MDKALRGFVGAPVDAAKSSRGIEKILAVLQIENGIAPAARPPITGRKMHQHSAAVAEDLRFEIGMALDVFQGLGHWQREAMAEEIRLVQRRRMSSFPEIPARRFRACTRFKSRSRRLPRRDFSTSSFASLEINALP